jgi:ferritin-like metal-binding protein YciE
VTAGASGFVSAWSFNPAGNVGHNGVARLELFSIIKEVIMKLGSLKDLYIQELKDLYSAENQILKALPKMMSSASSQQVQQAFQSHLEQTKSQIERLNEIFSRMGESGRGHKCEGMEGIITEGETFIKSSGDPSVKDAALISCAQKVEHYEMAGYGTCRTYAQILGENEAASLLEKTLEEEKKTDKLLTRIAEQSVNVQSPH